MLLASTGVICQVLRVTRCLNPIVRVPRVRITFELWNKISVILVLSGFKDEIPKDSVRYNFNSTHVLEADPSLLRRAFVESKTSASISEYVWEMESRVGMLAFGLEVVSFPGSFPAAKPPQKEKALFRSLASFPINVSPFFASLFDLSSDSFGLRGRKDFSVSFQLFRISLRTHTQTDTHTQKKKWVSECRSCHSNCLQSV